MKKSLQEWFATARAMHQSMYELLPTVASAVKDETTCEELADAAYALRETKKYLEDALKDVRVIEELAIKKACMQWTQEQRESSIFTEHCSASPIVQRALTTPSRSSDKEAYEALMRGLKIPEELWKNVETFRLHWPGLTEYLTEKLAAGLPLPDGVDPAKLYSVFKLRVVQRKGVLE